MEVMRYELYGILKICINFTKGHELLFFLRRENFFQIFRVKKNLYFWKKNLEKINDRKKIDVHTVVKNCFHIRGAANNTRKNKQEEKKLIHISRVSFFTRLIIRKKIRIEHAAKLKASGRNEQ